jgi:hypothetical protein
MKKHFLFLILFLLTGCQTSTSGHLEKTIKIEKIFPILEENKVEGYRDLDWCKAIVYNKGTYAEPSCKNYLNPENFDDDAKKLFNDIHVGLDGTNVIGIVNPAYENGKIIHGTFDFHTLNPFDRVRYVYKLNHKITSTQPPKCIGELDYMDLNQNWIFECEDWN